MIEVYLLKSYDHFHRKNQISSKRELRKLNERITFDPCEISNIDASSMRPVISVYTRQKDPTDLIFYRQTDCFCLKEKEGVLNFEDRVSLTSNPEGNILILNRVRMNSEWDLLVDNKQNIFRIQSSSYDSLEKDLIASDFKSKKYETNQYISPNQRLVCSSKFGLGFYVGLAGLVMVDPGFQVHQVFESPSGLNLAIGEREVICFTAEGLIVFFRVCGSSDGKYSSENLKQIGKKQIEERVTAVREIKKKFIVFAKMTQSKDPNEKGVQLFVIAPIQRNIQSKRTFADWAEVILIDVKRSESLRSRKGDFVIATSKIGDISIFYVNPDYEVHLLHYAERLNLELTVNPVLCFFVKFIGQNHFIASIIERKNHFLKGVLHYIRYLK